MGILKAINNYFHPQLGSKRNPLWVKNREEAVVALAQGKVIYLWMEPFAGHWIDCPDLDRDSIIWIENEKINRSTLYYTGSDIQTTRIISTIELNDVLANFEVRRNRNLLALPTDEWLLRELETIKKSGA